MPVMIYDPVYEAHVRSERERLFPNKRDEVWNGVIVMPPMPNNEHQAIVMKLAAAFSAVIDWDAGDQALPGANVSDRDADWMENYREPDAVVYLATNSALDRNTHWVGGPDLAVEVVSPGEDPRAKLSFYAQTQTCELLIVDRYPWSVEHYQLQNDQLVLVGTATESNGVVLRSGVLPLTFRLEAGKNRPRIVITHIHSDQTWNA